jgi:hypothetical protein
LATTWGKPVQLQRCEIVALATCRKIRSLLSSHSGIFCNAHTLAGTTPLWNPRQPHASHWNALKIYIKIYVLQI